ncbi:MAG: hypothetical protein IT428_05240 [Planctomycetaceae bacterium]|nr:hypothetical protein [Planctomycetaceae bacterium]
MFKSFLTLAWLPTALLSVAFVGDEARTDEKTKTCCELQLKCCKPQSACCVADKRLGCCEKGQKCCAERRDCCVGVQKCCQTGETCCDQQKACCGKESTKTASIRGESLFNTSAELPACCAKAKKVAACCEQDDSREFAVAELPGSVTGCPKCAKK